MPIRLDRRPVLPPPVRDRTTAAGCGISSGGSLSLSHLIDDTRPARLQKNHTQYAAITQEVIGGAHRTVTMGINRSEASFAGLNHRHFHQLTIGECGPFERMNIS
jgi:hypothetical protein